MLNKGQDVAMMKQVLNNRVDSHAEFVTPKTTYLLKKRFC